MGERATLSRLPASSLTPAFGNKTNANQKQDTPLRPGDRAFVIANLDFAALSPGNGGGGGGGGGASAWPEGTMGFDHDVDDEAMAEFLAAAAALTRRARAGVGGGGGGGGGAPGVAGGGA